MEIKKNSFKVALKSRERAQIGLWLGLVDPICAEICAGAGFDWLLIDGEHAPNDVRTILAQLQAVAPYPVHPIVRPVSSDVNLIKQLLDIGAQTLLVPMVESAEQARLFVAAMRYAPVGIRGVGAALARASQWNRVTNYLHEANDQMCLLVQVETRRDSRTWTRLPQSTAWTPCSSDHRTCRPRLDISASPDTPTCNKLSGTPSFAFGRGPRRRHPDHRRSAGTTILVPRLYVRGRRIRRQSVDASDSRPGA